MEFRLKMMPSRRRISSFANKNEQVRNILTMNGGYKDRIRKGRKKKKKRKTVHTNTMYELNIVSRDSITVWYIWISGHSGICNNNEGLPPMFKALEKLTAR